MNEHGETANSTAENTQLIWSLIGWNGATSTVLFGILPWVLAWLYRRDKQERTLWLCIAGLSLLALPPFIKMIYWSSRAIDQLGAGVIDSV